MRVWLWSCVVRHARVRITRNPLRQCRLVFSQALVPQFLCPPFHSVLTTRRPGVPRHTTFQSCRSSLGLFSFFWLAIMFYLNVVFVVFRNKLCVRGLIIHGLLRIQSTRWRFSPEVIKLKGALNRERKIINEEKFTRIWRIFLILVSIFTKLFIFCHNVKEEKIRG